MSRLAPRRASTVADRRDRDPRAPAEALPGAPGGARPAERWRPMRRRPRRRRGTPAAAGAPQPRRPPAAGAGRSPPPPPPPKPDPPYVAGRQDAQEDPVLGHARARPPAALGASCTSGRSRRPPKPSHGPLGDGAEVYASAARAATAPTASGGVGRQLNDGEVLQDLPAHRGPAQLRLHRHAGATRRRHRPYGDPDRAGGPHVHRRATPARRCRLHGGALTEAEILAVVCHERYDARRRRPERRAPSSPSGAPRTGDLRRPDDGR